MTIFLVFVEKVIYIDRGALDKIGLFLGALVVCTAFATLLYPVFYFGILHYNPFTNPTDILVNLFFAVFIL